MDYLATVGYGCSNECGHCGNNSSPKRLAEALNETDIEAWADVAGKSGAQDVEVSGGEPFVYPHLLRAADAAAVRNGLGLYIITNTFWASSIRKASKTLGSFSGLGALGISTDSFHQERIPVANVANALIAAATGSRHPKLELRLGNCGEDSFWGNLRKVQKSLEKEGWYSMLVPEADAEGHIALLFHCQGSGEEGYAILVSQRIGKVGRGASLAALEPARAGEYPFRSFFCADDTLTLAPVGPDGGRAIYACCSYNGLFPENRLFSFRSGEMPSAAEIEAASKKDSVPRTLEKRGSRKVSAELAGKGFAVPETSACEACRYLKSLPAGEQERAYSALETLA